MAVNEHEETRARLPLAAAGALEAGEREQIERHLAGCAACAAEWERWRLCGLLLKRLPTPQPSPLVVERARARAVARLLETSDERSTQVGILLAVLVAWTLTLGSGVVVLVLTRGIAAAAELFTGNGWLWVAAYTTAGWFLAAVASAVLGRRYRTSRGLA
ncbi:MAG: zf-HC2 domain-containing protein [Acidobacteriia bacterium]|jgi:anti-sigma factor RsiW|nr:zf-HC2 domain-containing protein [Terriglobia bacterium]